jgi:hypothetical protein
MKFTKYITRFHIQNLKLMTTECPSEFYMDITRNRNHFPTQHKLTGLYYRNGVCLLHGTD